MNDSQAANENWRPEIPPTVNAEWSDVLRSCWNTVSEDRPTFNSLLERIRFSSHLIVFSHSFPFSADVFLRLVFGSTFPHSLIRSTPPKTSEISYNLDDSTSPYDYL